MRRHLHTLLLTTTLALTLAAAGCVSERQRGGDDDDKNNTANGDFLNNTSANNANNANNVEDAGGDAANNVNNVNNANNANNNVEDTSNNAPDADVIVEEDIPPDVPPVEEGNACAAKDAPVQLANTCIFEWTQCEDEVDYTFRCDIQNVGGNIFSLCNCFEDGVMDPADKIVDICGNSEWADIEAIVNEECGWELR